MKLRLVDYMALELEGKGKKEARVIKARWHATAKRYLRMMEVTSDPIPRLPTSGDRVVPVPGFFLRRPVAELIELYRQTKPRTSTKRA